MKYVPQVGGDHYKAVYQHWDLVEDNDIAYLEAQATRYIARWRKKGTPRQDLMKAVSFLNKMGRPTRRHADPEDLQRFYVAMSMELEDYQIILMILHPERGSLSDIAGAALELERLAEVYA